MDDVHRMLAEFADAGLSKDEITFTTLIGAHALAGDIDSAKAEFDSMEEAGAFFLFSVPLSLSVPCP